MRGRPRLGVAASALLLAGCGGPQSILGTRNPGGADVEFFWWTSFLTTGTLSLLTMLALVYAVRRARGAGREEADHAETRDGEEGLLLVVGGLIPLAVLATLLVVSVRIGGSAVVPPGEPTRTIEVIGHMFWWEIRYPGEDVVTANELHIPAGEAVSVRVTSSDVIHSFWVPQLSPGKVDMVPGRTNLIWMYADEPGRYRGQCTEFCGVQHALMSMEVVATPPEEFEEWLERRREPAAPPTDPDRARGLGIYIERGCGVCHSIRGATSLEGPLVSGPDLTDLGARRTLGALTVPNTPSTLARWIANPHDLKPGVRMPPTSLPPEDLDALVAYLSGLEP